MALLVRALVKLTKLLQDLALNPVLASSALAFLAYGPAELVNRVLDHDLLKTYTTVYGLKTALRILLALGSARTLNRFANRAALNNWRTLAHRGWDWPSEVAVVTGGCNGIGKGIVLAFIRKGVRVAILDVAEFPADLAAIDAITYWKCDVTSTAEVNEAAEGIRKVLGNPSILVNNAGIASFASILDVSEEKLSKTIGVNLQSLWTTTKAFLPGMILKNKGHIVTISSAGAFTSVPLAVDYAATKAGAMAFNEGLATEIKHIYKSSGILTTIVHPVYVETNMSKQESKILNRQNRDMMRAEDVGATIAGQVFSRRGGQLIIPSHLSWISTIRAMPNWMQELIRDVTGKV